METDLTGEELIGLIQRVFKPGPSDGILAVLVDLPESDSADNENWKARREMAAGWLNKLKTFQEQLKLDCRLYLYPSVNMNNADLPGGAWLYQGQTPLPSNSSELAGAPSTSFTAIFSECSILLAITEYSATAPLKLAAKKFGFRAATMPGFSRAMLPALRLDYNEVSRRVERIKHLLDAAEAADLFFQVHGDSQYLLKLDLRHRKAHASDGLFPQSGLVGNLPSGEAYIVPYEGEVPGVPSQSEGELPVQFGDEVVIYSINNNRAISARGIGIGPVANQEAAHLKQEPAYGNIAELGFGVLADFGIHPINEILLDEKLGLHVAFGRSDHFGGQVGAAQFTAPEAVVHIDRVYLPALQPSVHLQRVVLHLPQNRKSELITNGQYVPELFN